MNHKEFSSKTRHVQRIAHNHMLCAKEERVPLALDIKEKYRLRDGAEENQSKERKYDRVLESWKDTSYGTWRLRTGGSHLVEVAAPAHNSTAVNINNSRTEKRGKKKTAFGLQNYSSSSAVSKLRVISGIHGNELLICQCGSEGTQDLKSQNLCGGQTHFSKYRPGGGTSFYSASPVNSEARQTLHEPSSRQLLHCQTKLTTRCPAPQCGTGSGFVQHSYIHFHGVRVPLN